VEDELQSDGGNTFEWQDQSTEIQVTVTSFSQKAVGSRPQIIATPKSKHGSNKGEGEARGIVQNLPSYS
jgi:hypothetical protein